MARQLLEYAVKKKKEPKQKIDTLLITDALNEEPFSFMRIYYLTFCRDKFIGFNFEEMIFFSPRQRWFDLTVGLEANRLLE